MSDREPREPARIGDLLRRLVSARGWEERVGAGSLRANWAAVVGEQVAARSEPVRLQDGVLTLFAESGAWATELTLLAPSIAQKADAYLGGDRVREVRILARERGRRAAAPDPAQRRQTSPPGPLRDPRPERPKNVL